MAHSDEKSVRATVSRFSALHYVFDVPVEPHGVMFSWSQPDTLVPPEGQPPEEPRSAKSATDRVWNLVGRNMAVALGPTLRENLK
jgi:hypothetical protein